MSGAIGPMNELPALSRPLSLDRRAKLKDAPGCMMGEEQITHPGIEYYKGAEEA